MNLEFPFFCSFSSFWIRPHHSYSVIWTVRFHLKHILRAKTNVVLSPRPEMEIKYLFTVFCTTVEATIAVSVRINTKLVCCDGFFIIFKVVSRRSRCVCERAAQAWYEEWRSFQKNSTRKIFCKSENKCVDWLNFFFWHC